MLDINFLFGKQIKINNNYYFILKGNNQDANCVSFFNIANGKFLRHYAYKLIDTDHNLNPQLFLSDSSFYPEESQTLQFAFYTKSKNVKFYICQDENNNFVISDKLVKINFDIINNYQDCLLKFNDLYIENLKNNIDLLNIITTDLVASKIANTSTRVHKKQSIVFVGTGSFGDNIIYVFKYLNKFIRENNINIELCYFAVFEREYDYFNKLQLPCILWKASNPEHIYKAVCAKIAVFSTHTFTNTERNKFLLACLNGAYKIQLWHGFAAKTIAYGVLKQKSDYSQIAMVLEDCAVDIVTVAIISEKIKQEYEKYFPGATVICTGDARTDALFTKDENSASVEQWIKEQNKKFSLIFTPTFRENTKDTINILETLLHFILDLDHKEFAIAIKFHPWFFGGNLDKSVRSQWLNKFSNIGVYIIEEYVDVYPLLNRFDALVTDYSSIRFDFNMTNKPILLFRPDYNNYTKCRTINPFTFFNDIDNLSYNITNNCSSEDIINILSFDTKKSDRIEYNKKLNYFTDSKSTQRTAELILSKLKLAD